MTDAYPFSPADSVSEQTLLNVEAMKQELEALRTERDERRAQASHRAIFIEQRISSLAQQLGAKALEVIELEAIVERVDRWKSDSLGTALAEAAAIELDEILSEASNEALVAHDSELRDDVLEEAIAIIAATPLDVESPPSASFVDAYERALRDAAARVAVVKELAA